MPKASYSVVFYGSYPMSLEMLKALMANKRLRVKAVVTTEAKPGGFNPILAWLNGGAADCAVLTADNLQKGETAKRLLAMPCDLVCGCAFPLKIPAALRAMAGCVALNVHPSLLPEYRGADPIRRALLDGRAETGVSLHELIDRFDGGALYAQWRRPIPARADCGSLYGQLSRLAARRIPRALVDIAEGRLAPWPQDETKATAAYAVTEDERRISAQMSEEDIARLLRACHPFSPAWIDFDGARYRLAPASFWRSRCRPSREISLDGGHLIMRGPDGTVRARIVDCVRGNTNRKE